VTNALFRIAGVVPRGVTEVDNIEAAKRMVERGLGVALLPGTAVADTLSGGSLREITLVGAATIRRRIVAVERPDPHPALPFLETLWGLLERIPELIPRALPIVDDI
jgi:DNA-binding transcriptional LysR family regulator